MVDGQRIHRVIGRESEGVTRSQAEEFIEKARTDAREDRLNLPSGRKTHLAFSDAGDKYLGKLEESGGKNIPRKRRHLALHLKPFFRDQRLNAITKFTVDRYKKRRGDAGAENATINRELATLSHLLSRAVEWKWIPARPCEIKLLEEGEGRIFTLTDGEADAAAHGGGRRQRPLLLALRRLRPKHSNAAFGDPGRPVRSTRLRQAAASCPRRQGGAARAADHARARGDAEARARHGGRSGGLDLPDAPQETRQGRAQDARMDRPFKRAVVAAGLEPETVTPHVMRHTAITNLVKSGADLPTIQKISGHRTLAMVLRYTHVHGRHIDRAIAAIGRTIPQQPGNEQANALTPELHRLPRRRV